MHAAAHMQPTPIEPSTESHPDVLEIDGSRYSGSGTIVRQAVAYAALTARPIHMVRARARRPKPGLRAQHLCVARAICDLSHGRLEGAALGSQEFSFAPGRARPAGQYVWDIGSAGSTTALALALLPVCAFARERSTLELRGGLFQDFATSVFHLQHVLLPLLARMGLNARASMQRPGYVPTGTGVLMLEVEPLTRALQPLVLEQAGAVRRIWGIALASRLRARRVSDRIAEAAQSTLAASGFTAEIDTRYDETAAQAGAAFALFADLADGVRLGADAAGAPRRRAETMGERVARQLLAAIASGSTVDRFAADQLLPFAALAAGETRVRIPLVTEHVQSGAWLAREFLGAEARVEDGLLTVQGTGFWRTD